MQKTGIPLTCTATYQKWTGQPTMLAGSKNPLSLDMGSVKKQGIKEIENMAEQLKDYTIDAAYTSPILRAKYTA